MTVQMLDQRFENGSRRRSIASHAEKMREAFIQASNKRLSLSLAQTKEERSDAESLLNRRFEWRGYGSNHRIANGDNHTTFLAHLGSTLTGTITLGIDTPNGLAIDALFKDQIDKYRKAPGARICELTKFAIERSGKQDSNRLLACLFHAVFLYGMDSFNCTDLFIEVNPRHCRFYQSMLNFKVIGGLRMNTTVGAPSQLMWLNVSQVADQIKEHRSGKAISKHSLYALFLTGAEEMMVKSRLALRREHPTLNTLFELEQS